MNDISSTAVDNEWALFVSFLPFSVFSPLLFAASW